MKDGEHSSDIESELASDDPMDVDNMVFSDKEESREVVVTSAERRDPTAMSAGEEHEATRHAVVPALRKCAASTDIVSEREAKRTWSPLHSEASPVLSSPAIGVAGQARWSKERARTRTSSGLATARDPPWEDILPAAPVKLP